MLSTLNRPNVIQALNNNREKGRNELNLTNDFVNKPKNSFRIKTEEMVKIHEQSCLKKKEIINTALKSQIADINIKLESRKFSKINKIGNIPKKHSLLLG